MADGEAAQVFAEKLCLLREQAGSPTYADLVLKAKSQKPAVKLTTSSLGDWFNGRTTPEAGLAINFLLIHLIQAAKGRGHQVPPLDWWQGLRNSAWRERHPGQIRRPSKRSLPHDSQGEEVEPEGGDVEGSPSSPENNRLILRWKTKLETIEFFDEGLALQWIKARIEMGGPDE